MPTNPPTQWSISASGPKSDVLAACLTQAEEQLADNPILLGHVRQGIEAMIAACLYPMITFSWIGNNQSSTPILQTGTIRKRA